MADAGSAPAGVPAPAEPAGRCRPGAAGRTLPAGRCRPGAAPAGSCAGQRSLHPGVDPAPAVPLHPLIEARRSPRAFDPSADLDDATLRALFEAARWAPSSGNLQPALYLLGRRGDVTHARLLDVLKPRNRTWAAAASALALGVARTADDTGRPVPHAVYDLGQATAQLALQAVALDVAVHQMGGFDADAARTAFDLAPHLQPQVVVALGRPGRVEDLPPDLQERERAPRRRRPLAETVFAGSWGTPAFGG